METAPFDDYLQSLQAAAGALRSLAGQPGAPSEAVSALGHLGTVVDRAAELIERHEAAASRARRYQALFENALDALAVFDDNGRLVEVNPSFCALVGRDREGLLGQKLWSLVPPDLVSRGRQLRATLLEHGEYRAEYEFLRRDGTRVPVEGRAVAHVLPGTHLVALRDITERRVSEVRLRQSAAQLKVQAELALALAGVTTSLQPVLNLLVRRVTEVLGDACVVNLLTDDRQSVTPIAWHHRDLSTLKLMDSLLMGSRVPVGVGLASRAALSGQSLLLAQVEPDDLRARVVPAWRAYLDHFSIYSMLVVPLRVAGEAQGSVTVTRERPGQPYTPDDQRFLEELAGLAGLAMANARLFETVRQELAAREKVEADRELLLRQREADRQRLEALTQRLLKLQEAERRALARELHDEIGQVLTALKINLQGLGTQPEPGKAAQLLTDSLEIVQLALTRVRQLSLDLRPQLLDDLGLPAALRWYLDRQAQRASFVLQFAPGPLPASLPPEVAITCFRVVQEAVTNVVRHACASKVRVDLEAHGDVLHLAVGDDGVGFDTAAAHAAAGRGGSLGLLSIHERVVLVGGHLEIGSSPGQGTVLRVQLPLAPGERIPGGVSNATD